LIDNSTQKKAHCTKKKTHGGFYRFRSFVQDALDVKNPKEIKKKKPRKENAYPLFVRKVGT
jgi:hypothetical protein